MLLFCPCLAFGEDLDSREQAMNPTHWRRGEYDVLTSEQVYVEVAAHRARCKVQPDMLAKLDANPA